MKALVRAQGVDSNVQKGGVQICKLELVYRKDPYGCQFKI